LTRVGFEADLQSELSQWASGLGQGSWSYTAAPGLLLVNMKQAQWQIAQAQWRDWRCFPVFAREVVQLFAEIQDLPRHGRVEQLLAALPEGYACTAVKCYAPDHNDARVLEPLARALEGHLSRALKTDPQSGQELHVILKTSGHAFLGSALASQRAPFTAGISRLKLPKLAPSRSTLKLEEAFLTLLDERERQRWLKPGMRAVDLGAAPGGWTYQMVQQQMRVTAVDNGPMAASLMQSGNVEHRRSDGFKYQPPRAVDWLLSDMVEKPFRVAQLVAQWLEAGWTQRAVVNLKLPMKRRVEELNRCLSEWRGLDVRCKQLYHDREEVTAVVISR